MKKAAPERSAYVCQECGARSPKWAGQCPECGAWNSLVETRAPAPGSARGRHYAGATAEVCRLGDVPPLHTLRQSTGLDELDRVLGGGLVAGSVVLIGGDPGIGKSTLLIQALAQMAAETPGLYVTGEESLQQVALRARRLGLSADNLQLMSETSIERIIATAEQLKPALLVVDSIQTLHSDQLQSAPGSVGQVRETAAMLVRLAKQRGISVFIVGHVTKEGALAGPRVLEHMVDTVLYFEGDSGSRYRLVRAVKNRFGAANELGVFAMTDQGLKPVSNPSAIFLSRHEQPVAGSVIMVTREGTRPLLVEVQALVADSPLGNPRRVAVGVEQNRLSLLLAVLHRHGGVAMFDQDVFLNVVGGVRVAETAADLAALLAIRSSFRDRPLPTDLVVFGEVGLAGEIRPVHGGPERLREAAKHGFRRAIVPHANLPPRPIPNMEIIAVRQLGEALDAWHEP
ncbi:MAG: DNA repair protein RadA [Halothiobacillaceae bacterium]|jgi:DNA repair protein RadA/Sms|nr:DNA repair protein RadA [Halothiobacillaceae bacterium]MDY0049805.1 DNA repair protein RadA [Halothiobacillaceae bacterium]